MIVLLNLIKHYYFVVVIIVNNNDINRTPTNTNTNAWK